MPLIVSNKRRTNAASSIPGAEAFSGAARIKVSQGEHRVVIKFSQVVSGDGGETPAVPALQLYAQLRTTWSMLRRVFPGGVRPPRVKNKVSQKLRKQK